MTHTLEMTAALIPVSEWTYDLYRVVYSNQSGATQTKYFAVSGLGQLDNAAQRNWPSDWYTEYLEEWVAEVPAPRTVGNLYGRKISEGELEHGTRVAKERGLVA